MSSELSNTQEEDHETDDNGIELTQQPEVLLDVETSANQMQQKIGPENREKSK